MSVSIQAKKRQKCFMIDPKDGVVQDVPSFTLEEEQGFAISKLELWQRASVSDPSEVIDPNHKKFQQFQDITSQITSRGSEKSISMDAPTRMKSALESAQKAAAELSMLVQLSSLLQSNKILSLQTRYTDSASGEEPSSGEHDHRTSKEKPKELPVAQRIGIQQASFSKANKSILAGLEQAKRLMRQRQDFANTLQQCKEDRSFHLCHVDRKTHKRVTSRKYEPRKDFIAADCSVATPTDTSTTSATNTTNSTLNSNKTGKWAARSTDPASTAPTATFVPILMGKTGIKLSAEEQAATICTLQFSLLSRNTAGVSSSAGGVATVGSATAWSILQSSPTDSASHAEAMDVEQHSASTVDSVQALSAHCRRRKHETLCRAAFARIQDECIRGAAQWDVLSGFDSAPSGADSSDAGVLGGTETGILSKIVVVAVREREVVLRVSEGLALVVALVPITGAGGTGSEWVHSVLSAMTLQSVLEILQPTSVASASTSSASSTHFGRVSQWRTVSHTQKATTSGNAVNNKSGKTSASGASTGLVTRLLGVLAARVEARRVNWPLKIRNKLHNLVCFRDHCV